MSPIMTRALAMAVMAAPALAQYSLQSTWDSSNFFDQFEFFDTTQQQDPTTGFVQYLNRDAAQSAGLLSTDNGKVTIRTDSTNSDPNGRASVRMQTTAQYNHGLFILDLNHAPVGCAVWPAYWFLGPDWPNNGEIDVIEGVHNQASDLTSLHTKGGCSRADTGSFTGTPGSTADCQFQPGCSVDANNQQSYGQGFNDNGGGVYATEWNSDAISVWFWPHSSAPGDIGAGTPDPSTWGAPTAQFYKSSCDIDTFFHDQQIIFNTEICGSWAGDPNVWSASGCQSQASTCQDFAQNNPGAFANAYWEINSLKIYAQGSSAASVASLPKAGEYHFNIEGPKHGEL